MSLQYIFNGYYRSGTTLFWEILKLSNPSFRVFYEPLHPLLINKIRYFQNNKKADDLHGKILWGEYVEQGDLFVNKIEKYHIFRKNIYPSNITELFNYLDIYNHLPIKSILQTNRLHFHLRNAIEHYGIKAFHIIRNPIDVFNSLLRIYQKSGHCFLKLLSFIKNRHTPKSNIYSIKKNIEYAYKNYHIPKYWGLKSFKQSILRDSFKTHLLSWTLSNFFAIKQKRNLKINIILYEDLIKNPNLVKRTVENYSDLSFDIKKVKICPKANINCYKNPEISEIIDSMGIDREYNYVIQKANL